MSEWKRLSARDGRATDDGPYEGVPGHLAAELEYWLQGVLNYRPKKANVSVRLTVKLASIARIRLDVDSGYVMFERLVEACRYDEDVFLDVIDAALNEVTDPLTMGLLKLALINANSIWTVNANGNGLVRRLDPTAVATKDAATAPGDLASTELKEAWANAYSLKPDASDTWDHSIKAMEAVLIPLVVPRQNKATLGHVVGELKGHTALWRLVLPGPGEAHDVGPLVSILDLAWPNSDRHANQHSRIPSLEEARALVHLAVTLVQWIRDGVLQRVP